MFTISGHPVYWSRSFRCREVHYWTDSALSQPSESRWIIPGTIEYLD